MPITDQIYDDPSKVAKPDAAVSLVWDSYNRSRNELVDKIRPRINELYRAYRAYVEKRDDDIQSNLVIPVAFTQVEAFAARTIANRPRIEVWPRGVEDRQRAEAHRVKVDYDWDHMSMPWKLLNFTKSGLIFGTAWMKAYYRRESRDRVVRKQQITPVYREIMGLRIPAGQELKMVEVEEPVLIWDDPDVDLLELDEVFPDPDGKDVDSCAWIIHRYTADLHEIENLQDTDGEPLYDPAVVKKLKARAQSNAEMLEKNETLRDVRGELRGDGGAPSIDPHKRRFHLLEMWSDDKVMTVVEEFLDLPPLRNERNRYGIKPFVIYTPIPDPNALYGISPVEIISSIQKELSTLHNARMDHVLQTVHAMMTIRRGSNINPKSIRVRPRGWAFVDEHDDIQWLRPPSLEFALYREDDNLQVWAQKAGGATDTFVGVHSAQSGRTATEASLLSQSSGSRSGLMLQILTIQSLNRLGRILMRINEVEMTAQRQLPAISADLQPLTVSPEILNGGSNLDLDVKIDVGETEPETKLFKRKEALEAIQIIGQLFPSAPGGQIHPFLQRFMVDLAETYDIHNAEQLVQVPAVQQPAPPGEGPSGQGGMGQELAAAFGQVAPGTGVG